MVPFWLNIYIYRSMYNIYLYHIYGKKGCGCVCVITVTEKFVFVILFCIACNKKDIYVIKNVA